MRLDYLAIKSRWKNLEGFRVDFDQARDVAVIIGRNGSAKSNLLEALIIIFTRIDLGRPAAFSFELKYSVDGKPVRIIAEENKQPKVEVDGSGISLAELRENSTPKYLVGYYSGVSDRFEQLFAAHDLQARNLTLTKAKKSAPHSFQLRRFICARPVHGLFALLAFYISKDEGVASFLRELPRIEDFDSALLVVRKPSWAKRGSGPDQFWGAQGRVVDLLKCFRRHSLAPFHRKVRVKLDFAKRATRELVYLYLPNVRSLGAVAREYGDDPASLFQALDSMRLSGLIEDFRVRVRVTGAVGAIHTRQLSEGEQQLLTVLGLMRFTRNTGSLYLLDEPDTHLNPSWEIDYLEKLRTIGGIERKSHTILATHDPLLVAGLCRQEIRVLNRAPNGRISATQPEEDPRGTGVAGVLTSPLYGLESQLDSFSLRVLKRIYEVTLQDRSERRKRHLKLLRRLIPTLETTEKSPDPYRNIARDAFRLAQDRTVETNHPVETKRAIVERLAKLLYDESVEEGE